MTWAQIVRWWHGLTARPFGKHRAVTLSRGLILREVIGVDALLCECGKVFWVRPDRRVED